MLEFPAGRSLLHAGFQPPYRLVHVSPQEVAGKLNVKSAGLSAAIRLKQIDPELNVVVLEKGSEVGAHILSGAVIDPRALDELLPEWRDTCPLAEVLVTENLHWALTRTGKWALPHLMMPPLMSNAGCYTGSGATLSRWLASSWISARMRDSLSE